MAKEKNKSITEEALLDLKTIQEALKANGKEILRSTMKGEIEEIVKESINEMDYEEEEIDDTESYDSEPAGEEEGEEVATDGIDNETDVEIDADIEGGESYDTDMEGGDLEGDYEDAEMDLTGSDEDDVIQIFKKLSGDDQIEVVGDTITLTVDEPGEYVIKTDGADAAEEEGYEGDVDADSGYEDDVVALDADAEIEGGEIEGDIEGDVAIDGEAGEEEDHAAIERGAHQRRE